MHRSAIERGNTGSHQMSKKHKAPGNDHLTAELFIIYPVTATKRIGKTTLYQEHCQKGTIVKVPKKGNLTNSKGKGCSDNILYYETSSSSVRNVSDSLLLTSLISRRLATIGYHQVNIIKLFNADTADTSFLVS